MNCPFCGAEERRDWGFKCGSGPAVANPERSRRCRESEVTRLMKERDEARAEALVHLGNKLQAEDERDAAFARIKRLEEAGDAMAAYEFLPDRLAEKWTEAKEVE